MITSSGRNIPDPPTDPEARRLWKLVYHADLYGASRQQIDDWLWRETMEEVFSPPIQSVWWRHPSVRFFAYLICAPIGVLAAIVYLWEMFNR